jgi:hypothetical protein
MHTGHRVALLFPHHSVTCASFLPSSQYDLMLPVVVCSASLALYSSQKTFTVDRNLPQSKHLLSVLGTQLWDSLSRNSVDLRITALFQASSPHSSVWFATATRAICLQVRAREAVSVTLMSFMILTKTSVGRSMRKVC